MLQLTVLANRHCVGTLMSGQQPDAASFVVLNRLGGDVARPKQGCEKCQRDALHLADDGIKDAPSACENSRRIGLVIVSRHGSAASARQKIEIRAAVRLQDVVIVKLVITT